MTVVHFPAPPGDSESFDFDLMVLPQIEMRKVCDNFTLQNCSISETILHFKGAPSSLLSLQSDV